MVHREQPPGSRPRTVPAFLENFHIEKILSTSERRAASHVVELWSNDRGERVIVKHAEPGQEHTLGAEAIGEKIFTRADLPCPQSLLTITGGEPLIIERYLDGFSDVANYEALAKSPGLETAKRGLIYDVWLHHYDRQPANFMTNGAEIEFIDFGGCLTSSPSGKIKGLPATVDEKTFYRCLKAFHSPRAVNPAYASVIDVNVGTEGIIIRDPQSLKKEMGILATRFDDGWIDFTVRRNVVPSQRINPARVAAIISDMRENSALTLGQFKDKFHRREVFYASYKQNFQEALETFTQIRDEFDSDESAYLKYALRRRRDELLTFLRQRIG